MSDVRTMIGEDGRPYINLEDIIKAIEDVKNRYIDKENSDPNETNFTDSVLKELRKLEEEYYNKYLFYKDKI